MSACVHAWMPCFSCPCHSLCFGLGAACDHMPVTNLFVTRHPDEPKEAWQCLASAMHALYTLQAPMLTCACARCGEEGSKCGSFERCTSPACRRGVDVVGTNMVNHSHSRRHGRKRSHPHFALFLVEGRCANTANWISATLDECRHFAITSPTCPNVSPVTRAISKASGRVASRVMRPRTASTRARP